MLIEKVKKMPPCNKAVLVCSNQWYDISSSQRVSEDKRTKFVDMAVLQKCQNKQPISTIDQLYTAKLRSIQALVAKHLTTDEHAVITTNPSSILTSPDDDILFCKEKRKLDPADETVMQINDVIIPAKRKSPKKSIHCERVLKEKRARNNNRERQRLQRLCEAFQVLKNILPTDKPMKTQLEILNASMEYINVLKANL